MLPGPGGTDQQSILLLMQSPQTEVLGITVVTGDAWLKEEVAHTLRMLEIIGRTDIPVVAGAEYPLVRRKEETELWEQQYRLHPVAGRMDSATLSSGRPAGRNARGKADHQAARTKMPRIFCCAWSTSIRTKSRSMKAGR